MVDKLSPRQVWERYRREFPESPLVLDHIGAEIDILFVHSPGSNSRDEHTKHLHDWIWEDKSMRNVGVGIMKYDNWTKPQSQPPLGVEDDYVWEHIATFPDIVDGEAVLFSDGQINYKGNWDKQESHKSPLGRYPTHVMRIPPSGVLPKHIPVPKDELRNETVSNNEGEVPSTD